MEINWQHSSTNLQKCSRDGGEIKALFDVVHYSRLDRGTWAP
jgi:hypothetical protein